MWHKTQPNLRKILITLSILLTASFSWGQQNTIVKGRVIDAETKEGLPFVNVAFLGTNIGGTTDYDGYYDMETLWASDSLQISYIGYESQTIKIKIGKKNEINFELLPEALNLEAVTVKAKKGRYRKKDNPAVALIRNVIKNKKNGRVENEPYYTTNKYEKVEMDINNISEEFMKRKAFKKFEFISDYVDTSEINGKPFLPIFMQELSSKIYYQKAPKKKKEYREGYKITGLGKYLEDESITVVLEKLYEDVDIRQNDINLLTQNFVSPLSIIAPDFYRFYIIDTIEHKGNPVIDLAFIPKNKSNLGFKGNLYVSLDSSFQVLHAEMGILKQVNLNFVQDLFIEQEFEQKDGHTYMTKEHLVIDYNLTKKGMGFFGKRTVYYNDYTFEQPKDPEIFRPAEDLIIIEGAEEQNDNYWEDNRPIQLNKNEEGVYKMIDTLFQTPAFKRIMDVMALLVSGYHEVGPVDFGPFGSFYSFNDVEGFRLRFGGRTNPNFSKRFQIEGYGAYGFGDKEPKYSGSLLYSFHDNFLEYPKHYIKFTYQHETNFPGQSLQFVNEDNFFLSFKRGDADKMIFYDTYKFNYFTELKNLTFDFSFENKKQRPLGSLSFQYFDTDDLVNVESVKTSEFGLSMRWAPKAEYFTTKTQRIVMYSQYPVFDLDYRYGVKNLLGGEHDYHLLKVHMFKRFRVSILGFTYSDFEAGKIWGKGIPYNLMFLPRANQTYAYQIFSYNMMNFLEFASDTYASVNVRHFFNGFFFNRIPLFKRLKLREVITFKALYGSIRKENDPEQNPTLIQFNKDEEGRPVTYSLKSPYMEASVGVSNIFKLIRVDLVQRLTHLDHPNIPQLWGVEGLGVRARLAFEF